MSTLNEVFSPDNIVLAYHRVNSWGYSLIKDKVGLRAFKNGIEKKSTDLSKRVLSGAYVPQRGFKFYMPKASGTFRTQTQLFYKDAIVYQAIGDYIAKRVFDKLDQHKEFVFGSIISDECKKGVSILEEDNPDFSFFKDWRPLHKKFRESVLKSLEEDRSTFKLETDITGFFDSIPHYNLFQTLRMDFGIEDEIIDFLALCLNEWSGTRDGHTKGVGIPQGPGPSYLLANMLLYKLDHQLNREGYSYYRYMDDMMVYGFDEEKLQEVLHTIDKYTKSHGLSINSGKTKINPVDPNNEDETAKLMKKISSVSFGQQMDDALLELDDALLNGELVDTFIIDDENLSKVEVSDHSLNKVKEELNKVETNFKNFFEKDKEGNLSLKTGVVDIDMIKSSSSLGEKINLLKKLDKSYQPNEELIPYFLFAIKKFFWRANGLLQSLKHYPKNDLVKSGLITLLDSFGSYEWVRFYLVTNLSFNHSYSDRELNEFERRLNEEKSELVRIALYRLLFVHQKKIDTLEALREILQNDSSVYVKRVIEDFYFYRIIDDDGDFEVISTLRL